MSKRVPFAILSELADRADKLSLRTLKEFGKGVDLCSNDYLGIAAKLAEPTLLATVCKRVEGVRLGATGSRLVSGTNRGHNQLEVELAAFHGAPAALIFGSGFEANMGLLSSVAKRTDTIIYDQHVHASMRDGIRLSSARSYSFLHNDLNDLKEKIARAKGTCYVAVESVYSMDGDRAPLAEICNLVNESGAYLIVDEAHATGVFGERGAGLVAQLGLCDHVFARVHTFGKAIGYRGGVVVGDASLREYLINVARPFVYSTAPDLLSIELIREAYRLTLEANLERAKLSELVATVIQLRSEYPEIEFLDSDTPIQGVVVSGNREALELERRLLDCGIFARAIRSPTVPLGLERIRICLHSFNTTGEVRAALDVVAGRSAAERSALNV